MANNNTNSINNVANLRRQVLENSEELQDFLRDLNNWEKDMKRKDEELRSTPIEPKKLPGIRKPTSKPKNEAISSDNKSRNVEGKAAEKLPSAPLSTDTEKRISSYDYAAWDKFDVKKELVKMDSEDKKADEVKIKEVTSSCSSSDEEDEELILQQLKQKALMDKDRGNQFFSEGKYDDAIAMYTSGMQADPKNAVLPANRAMALIKKGQLAAAEQDCTLSISLDYTYAKAFHRRGTCRFALKKYQLARQDFLKVLELEPGNKFARAELDKLESEFRKNDRPHSEPKESKSASPSIGSSPSEEMKSSEEIKTLTSPSNKNAEEIESKSATTDLDSKSHTTKKTKSIFAELLDQVKPIYKPAHLKSKKPLQRLEIEVVSSDEEVEVVIPSALQRPASLSYASHLVSSSKVQTPITPVFTPTTPKSLPAAPQTAFQFETDWRRLKHWPSMRVQYLKQINPESLPQMYQHSMETEIFIGIIQAIKVITEGDRDAAFLYLKYLTGIGRFQTIIMFMSTEETQLVEAVLEAVSDNKTSQEIKDLRVLYGL